MKRIILSLISILLFQLINANSVIKELRKIDPYIKSNPDTAILLSKELLNSSIESSNYFGIVKANLYLGYLYEGTNPGKSVIYYLEGIRYSELAPLDSVKADRIWLHRNIGNIFRKYESNQLATEYNLKGIELAKAFEVQFQINDLKFHQSLVYQNDKQFDLAIRYMSEILDDISDEVFRAEVINQIGLVYLEWKDYENATHYFDQLIDLPIEAKIFTSKALHNLGEIAYEQGDKEKAIQTLEETIRLFSEINSTDYYSLFLSYRNIGRYLFEVGQIDAALFNLEKAEEIFEYAKNDPSSFELFSILSNVYFNIGDKERGNEYSRIYFDKVQEFIESQTEIQRKDKEYNFELITKRYFDNVEKQERMASIMMYSKLSTGGLILLLIMVVTYYQMEKRRLRKSIERELKTLNILP